jgi:hypothetical protein
MDARGLPAAVRAAATDRRGGAMEVAATALDGLLEVAADPPLLEEAVAVLLAGQPAMAPVWHLAVAARAPDPAAALAGLRHRLGADADAAVAAATAWLCTRLANTRGGVATVSHSSLVDRVLARVADPRGTPAAPVAVPDPDPDPGPGPGPHPHPPMGGPPDGRVARGGNEGERLSTAPVGAPVVGAPGVGDPEAGDPVVGVVGADAIGPEAFLNADGTGALAAQLPTLVVATAVKLVPGTVFGRMGGPGFEVVPLDSVAAVVVGPEVLSPAEAGRRARDLAAG